MFHKKTNQEKNLVPNAKNILQHSLLQETPFTGRHRAVLGHSSFSLAGGSTGEKLTSSDSEGREALEEEHQCLTPRGSSSGRCYDHLVNGCMKGAMG